MQKDCGMPVLVLSAVSGRQCRAVGSRIWKYRLRANLWYTKEQVLLYRRSNGGCGMKKVLVMLLCLLAVGWGGPFCRAQAETKSNPAPAAKNIQLTLSIEITCPAAGATKEDKEVNNPILTVPDGHYATISLGASGSGRWKQGQVFGAYRASTGYPIRRSNQDCRSLRLRER